MSLPTRTRIPISSTISRAHATLPRFHVPARDAPAAVIRPPCQQHLAAGFIEYHGRAAYHQLAPFADTLAVYKLDHPVYPSSYLPGLSNTIRVTVALDTNVSAP